MSSEVTENILLIPTIGAEDDAVVKQDVATGYRTSPQQRQVWERQRRAGDDDTRAAQFCAQLVLSLEGDADEGRLRAAVEAVIARHESLRTGFVKQPGTRTPLQVVAERAELNWRGADFRAEDEETRQRLVEEVLDEERGAVGVTGQTATPRAALLRTGARSRLLALTLAALCADEWSLEIAADEVRQAYDALALGRDELRLEEPVQYLQFSEWQNELLEDEEAAREGCDFWRAQHAGALAPPRLPFEVPGKLAADGRKGFRPQSLSLSLDDDLALKLEAVAARHGVAPPSALQASWEALLWRLGGGDDFALLRPSNGRQYEELGEAVGLFARVLRLRQRISGAESFHKLARRVETELSEAESWQEYHPTEEADAAGAVGFEYVECGDNRLPAASADGVVWSVKGRRCELEQARLWLRCEREAAGGLRAELLYDARALAAEDAARLGEHWVTLLRSAVERPASAVGELEIMGQPERDYVVRDLNLTAEGFASHASIVEMFEETAARCASRVAVIGETEELTYAELNARANQLARHLRRLGVGPETPVAVCIGRSARAMVAMLGVMKAGGAYLPLDTAYAGERLAFMLEDAGARVLLTERRLVESLPATGARVICLDSDDEAIARECVDNPAGGAAEANLAYVIYTSGSTGRPKGVGVEHRQLLNYVKGVLHRLELPEGASFATVSTFAADLGHTAIFPALCSGGCLHVISQERANDPDALADYFSRKHIDCLKIVPGHLEALLASPRMALLMPRLRLVLGGEASRPQWVEKLKSLGAGCRILNHYGPTETTVGVLTYAADAARLEHASTATLPLGRPLPNTQVYLLDEHLQPVPAGVMGELYVGGAGVSRGYLNRPDLTAERFVPDPFSAAPGARLYRTGDLARHLPGGEIEFLGRADNQVKIRGFRVELGEIECALAEHPAVREAVVSARNDATGVRLVAYLVARQGHAPSVEELPIFLKAKLPEHMIPATFILLKSLPLNPNGKIDRKALPEPGETATQLGRVFVAPRDTLEGALADIWASVLKLERVGVEDSFFALGGHSLAAMQIMSRVRNTFYVELPLRVVFEATTIAALAEAIKMHETEPGRAAKIAGVMKRLQEMTPEQKQALMKQKGLVPDEERG